MVLVVSTCRKSFKYKKSGVYGVKVLDIELKTVVEAYVKIFEDSAKLEEKYEKAVKEMQRINLKDITEQDVEGVIKPFLLDWGRMGLVLGKRKYKGWERQLKNLIKEYSSMLANFRKESLAKVEQFEREIKDIYGKFREILGVTAAGKTLHLICPNFFPLWDNNIRSAFSQAFDIEDDDYYTFMLKVRDFVSGYEETFSRLANRYNRSILRIFDEFAWQISHNPLSIF